MKSILIIGLGRFGHHLCINMASLGNDVMIVDQKEECLEDLLPYVTSAKIGDCTNETVLKSLGIPLWFASPPDTYITLLFFLYSPFMYSDVAK